MTARRLARRVIVTIDSAARRITGLAGAAVQTGFAPWSNPITSDMFFPGVVGGAGLTVAALHQADHGQVELALAFALAPVDTWAGKITVVAAAAVALIGFLVWSKRTTSAAFFRGVLSGTGCVLSFDIVWIHWIFGLHHITNTEMDFVLEPLFVLLGLIFLLFGITRERRHAP